MTTHPSITSSSDITGAVFVQKMPRVCCIIQVADEEATLSKVWQPQGGMQESTLQGQQVVQATQWSQIQPQA